jgi:hypothetical protein
MASLSLRVGFMGLLHFGVLEYNKHDINETN